MNNKSHNVQNSDWSYLVDTAHLSPQQEEQFKIYANLLVEYNEKFNLTALTAESDIVNYHFFDSLVPEHLNLQSIHAIADVGAGAGFPGVPLAIKYPHLKVFLIEVNEKKQQFLTVVVRELGLSDIVVCPQDWRTFLRTTNYSIDLFCARASLRPDELLRAFKANCPYQNAMVLYWASEQWKPDDREQLLLKKSVMYEVGTKKRQLALFACAEPEPIIKEGK